MRAVVVTISDKGYTGEREDRSGPILAEALGRIGAQVVDRRIVPDEPDRISALLAELADRGDIDLIATTGGTGIAPRDRTPEATRAVIEREVPGIAEALRFDGYRRTPLAAISRGIAGIRGQCLIVNLPGSPRAVAEGMETLGAILPHAIQMMRGENLEHGEHHNA
jgi:molybdopterin adenylyltransferase